MKFEYRDAEESVGYINSFLDEKRRKDKFTVIDVGASASPFFANNCDAFLDFVTPKTKSNKKFFRGDITTEDGWKEVLEYVKENGKFDFAVCKQTVEDLHIPEFVFGMLSKIAKSGWVGIPSKYCECIKNREGIPNSIGLSHHFWVFVTHENKLYALPKLGWFDSIEYGRLNFIDKLSRQELGFFWEDSIEMKFVLPYTYSQWTEFPDGYLDSFLTKCLEGTTHPRDLWINILNNSD